jgi:hypothetical protein
MRGLANSRGWKAGIKKAGCLSGNPQTPSQRVKREDLKIRLAAALA